MGGVNTQPFGGFLFKTPDGAGLVKFKTAGEKKEVNISSASRYLKHLTLRRSFLLEYNEISAQACDGRR